MQIETRRFLIRDFAPDDAPAFLAYHADPRSSKFHGQDAVPPGALLTMFQDWATEHPRRNYQFAVVQRREPYSLVGCAGLRCAGLPSGQAEFGVELAPDYWGAYAYAVEIGRALLDFGFETLGLEVVVGSTVGGNSAVARLAEWFGAEIVATRPGPDWMLQGDWRSVDWRITREVWQHQTS
jgi:RimJ/RimL family protein N-acetyltransferase